MNNNFAKKKTLVDKVIKDDRIVIKIDSNIKKQFVDILEKRGTTPSDYLRQYIIETIQEQNNIVSESSKSYLFKMEHPEIEIYQRLVKLETKMNEIENILKNKGIVKY